LKSIRRAILGGCLRIDSFPAAAHGLVTSKSDYAVCRGAFALILGSYSRAADRFPPVEQLDLVLSQWLRLCLRATTFGATAMLRYALIFLVIALLASAFGMWQLEGMAMEAARILFFVFLVIFVVSAITRGRTPLA
jgi:uncharacterized membrane protein YtjA (UPF0391 family)